MSLQLFRQVEKDDLPGHHIASGGGSNTSFSLAMAWPTSGGSSQGFKE
jgi:hypothetical protein